MVNIPVWLPSWPPIKPSPTKALYLTLSSSLVRVISTIRTSHLPLKRANTSLTSSITLSDAADYGPILATGTCTHCPDTASSVAYTCFPSTTTLHSPVHMTTNFGTLQGRPTTTYSGMVLPYLRGLAPVFADARNCRRSSATSRSTTFLHLLLCSHQPRHHFSHVPFV